MRICKSHGSQLGAKMELPVRAKRFVRGISSRRRDPRSWLNSPQPRMKGDIEFAIVNAL
jgi:hypothetical protein